MKANKNPDFSKVIELCDFYVNGLENYEDRARIEKIIFEYIMQAIYGDDIFYKIKISGH